MKYVPVTLMLGELGLTAYMLYPFGFADCILGIVIILIAVMGIIETKRCGIWPPLGINTALLIAYWFTNALVHDIQWYQFSKEIGWIIWKFVLFLMWFWVVIGVECFIGDFIISNVNKVIWFFIRKDHHNDGLYCSTDTEFDMDFKN